MFCVQNCDAAHIKHIESRPTTVDKITDSTACSEENYQLEFVVILESSSKPCLESITESIRECCLSVQVLHSNQQGYEEEMFAVLFSDVIGKE